MGDFADRLRLREVFTDVSRKLWRATVQTAGLTFRVCSGILRAVIVQPIVIIATWLNTRFVVTQRAKSARTAAADASSALGQRVEESWWRLTTRASKTNIPRVNLTERIFDCAEYFADSCIMLTGAIAMRYEAYRHGRLASVLSRIVVPLGVFGSAVARFTWAITGGLSYVLTPISEACRNRAAAVSRQCESAATRERWEKFCNVVVHPLAERAGAALPTSLRNRVKDNLQSASAAAKDAAMSFRDGVIVAAAMCLSVVIIWRATTGPAPDPITQAEAATAKSFLTAGGFTKSGDKPGGAFNVSTKKSTK